MRWLPDHVSRLLFLALGAEAGIGCGQTHHVWCWCAAEDHLSANPHQGEDGTLSDSERDFFINNKAPNDNVLRLLLTETSDHWQYWPLSLEHSDRSHSQAENFMSCRHAVVLSIAYFCSSKPKPNPQMKENNATLFHLLINLIYILWQALV